MSLVGQRIYLSLKHGACHDPSLPQAFLMIGASISSHLSTAEAAKERRHRELCCAVGHTFVLVLSYTAASVSKKGIHSMHTTTQLTALNSYSGGNYSSAACQCRHRTTTVRPSWSVMATCPA